jgi:hypothetical protein
MMERMPLDDLLEWFAYWKVEGFGEEWSRTATQTLFILKALGADVDETFIERFLPGYDPDRPMTQDEMDAQMARFTRNA